MTVRRVLVSRGAAAAGWARGMPELRALPRAGERRVPQGLTTKAGAGRLSALVLAVFHASLGSSCW